MKKLSKLFVVVLAPFAFAACSGSDVEIAPVAMPQEAGEESTTMAGYDTETAKMAMPAAEAEKLQMKMLEAVDNGNNVYFGFDSSAINQEGQSSLQRIAGFLKSNNVNSVIVEGHCDERGTREYNLALGDRRAVAVKKYLVGLGVPAHTITTISYGKERPANPGHTEEAWAENRRGTVVIK